MNKIYVATVVCLLLAVTGISQTTYYWIGPFGGQWEQGSNWSLTSGGAAAGVYPSTLSDNVILDANDSIVFNSAAIDINSLTITNGKTVKIIATNGTSQQLSLHSTNAGAPGLKVDAGSTLVTDGSNGTEFIINFPTDAKGVISGDWQTLAYGGLSYFTIASDGTTTSVTFTSGSNLIVGPNGTTGDNEDGLLIFQNGATIILQTDQPLIPRADYAANSTILLTGVTDNGVAIDETGSIGNLVYNCPNQNGANSLALINLNINGSLSIQNTNGQDVTILGNGGTGLPTNTVGILGNLSISGNSRVFESKVDGIDKTMTLTVQGDFNNSAYFDMQNNNDSRINPTSLVLKKNYNETGAGVFKVSSTAVSSANIFNLEFNGSTTQTVVSASGTVDNATHQVTMKINNSLGVTLASPLQVGRLDFTGATPGKLTTSLTNLLTINGTGSGVVTGASNSGYVNGPMRMTSTSGAAVTFPSGVSNVLRALTITPTNTATNTFQVNLKSGSNGGALGVFAGLANYYWDVSQVSGTSQATVAMPLVGAVAGPSAADTLLPAAYNGSAWTDARGNFLMGDATTGTLTTSNQSTFTSFTIGYKLNASLATHLISFTGHTAQNAVDLRWTITDNSTPARFEVMKSADGVHFTSTGSVAGGDGTLSYTFTDHSPAAGNNFYRLKMFDRDGSVTYSNIIIVLNGSQGIAISGIMPTIVRDRAKLAVSAGVRGTLELVITDISGRIVRHQLVSVDQGSQDVWLDAASLPAGMFQVTGYLKGEKTATFRFIKQ